MHLGGHHQVPVRAAADGDRDHARLHRAVRRRHHLAPRSRRAEIGDRCYLVAALQQIRSVPFWYVSPSHRRGYRDERTEPARLSAGRGTRGNVFGCVRRRRWRRVCRAPAPSTPPNTSQRRNHSDAPHQVFRYRPRPRAHLRHDPRHPARRRRAGVVLRAGSGADRPVPQGIRRREARRQRRRDPRRQIHPAGAGRADPRPARAARHSRHEGRQGLPRRQARHHLARTTRRRAQGHQGHQAQVRHHVFRAPRSALRRARRRTHPARRDRQGDPDREPRAASRERAEPPRRGSSTSRATAASSPTSARTRPTSSSITPTAPRRTWSPRRPATSPIRSIRSSKTSATW